jgi:RNA polymerase sigma-70 factor (ECF subfamily)
MNETSAPKLRVVRPPSDRSDDTLCRAFLAGEAPAFGELVRRHQELVFRVVRRYAATPDEAHDLAQRAFLRSFEAARRSLPRLGRAGPVPFRAWLLRIALNLGKNHLRARRLWKPAPANSLDTLASSALDANDAMARAEQQAQVRAAVLTLPRRQREVLTLRVDGALPFSEVGEALGITEGNAKVNFCLAVKRLKEELR